jgi:hypothetical protein
MQSVAPTEASDASALDLPDPNQCGPLSQNFGLTSAGQERMRAFAQKRDTMVASLQRHSRSHGQLTDDSSPRDALAVPVPSAQPSSSNLHARARAAVLSRTAPGEAQGWRRSSDDTSMDLGALALTMQSMQRQLEQSAGVGAHAPSLGVHDLGRVAATAAVAAAQAVKKDSDSELSQVLKAVLLQQSRLGLAAGRGQGGGSGLGVNEGADAGWVGKQSQGNVHVQGQLLVAPSSVPCSTATPQVRCLVVLPAN